MGPIRCLEKEATRCIPSRPGRIRGTPIPMCSDGTPIPTCDLMAYVDGEATPAIAARIACDPYWSAAARTYGEFQQALRRHLHRFDCPAPLTLGEYDCGLFGRRDQPGIAWHADAC